MPFELFIDWHLKDIYIFIPILGTALFEQNFDFWLFQFGKNLVSRNLGQHVGSIHTVYSKSPHSWMVSNCETRLGHDRQVSSPNCRPNCSDKPWVRLVLTKNFRTSNIFLNLDWPPIWPTDWKLLNHILMIWGYLLKKFKD